MSRKSSYGSKKSSKKRSTNRSIKRFTYGGASETSKKAFGKTGLKQDIHILLTGKRYSSEEMRRLYKKNRRNVVVREAISDLFTSHQKQSKEVEKMPVRRYRNRAAHNEDKYISAYNEFDKKFRNINSTIINSFKRVEALINNCHSFVECVKKALPAISKVVAFIRLIDDGRKIIISIISINESINELIDIATTEDNDIVPIKDEFKTLVGIIKETKDIYCVLQDAVKQAGVVLLG